MFKCALWFDIRECCVVFSGPNNLNCKDVYFIHLKVLREYNQFSPCAKPSNEFLAVELQKDGVQIPLKISLGK